MVKCCVLWCENDSIKQQHVSFHQLPPDVWKKNAYICMNTESEEALFACTEHFKANDFILDKDGNMQLKRNAMPVIRLCRICLQTNVKMVEMSQNNLNNIYKDVIGVAVDMKDICFSNMLCVQCAHRLRNYHRFKEKCDLAHSILVSLTGKNKQMSKNKLTMLNRERSQLKSTLNVKKYGPNYCDISLNHDILSTIDDDEHIDDKYEVKFISNDIKNRNNRNTEIPISNNDDNDFSKTESSDSEQPSKQIVLKKKTTRSVRKNRSQLKPTRKSTRNVKKSGPNHSDISLNHDIVSKIDDDEHIDDKYEVKFKSNDIKNENDLNTEIPISNNDDNDFSETESSDDEQPLKQIVRKKKTTRSVRKKASDKGAERFKVLIDGVDDNLFTRTKRSEQEQMTEILKRKESHTFKNAPLPCTVCYKAFRNEASYSAHMLKHSDAFGLYPCTICKVRFKTRAKASSHKSTTHGFEYRCNQCYFVTASRVRAKLHGSWHKGKTYECPHCNEVFKNRSSYMTHIRIKHPSDFVCDLCGYAFVGEKGLFQHKSLKHKFCGKVPDDGPLCDTCNIRFISDDALLTHLNVSAKHNNMPNANESSYPRAPTNDSMKKNYNPHLTCEQCGMEITGWRAYYHHFRTTHPGKNRTQYPNLNPQRMCDQCGKIFHSYAQLEDHSHVHTNDTRFKCLECGKSFRTKGHLRCHGAAHTSQRFPCGICGKNFTRSHNRDRHVLIHSETRPYKCDFCSKTFKSNAEKKGHTNYVHLKKPWPKRARSQRPSRQGEKMQSTEGASETDVQTWLPDDNDMNGSDDSDDHMYYVIVS